MKLILGKKLEMTQIFREDGAVIPVTAVLATPNVITQIKSTSGKDGYDAVQIGYGVTKKNGKSKAGHLKDLAAVRTIKEFRVEKEDTASLKRGDEVTVSVFVPGDEVKVTGTSKGKGFQGVVKRHKFHGAPKSHGHKDQERMPGSIGAGGVQRVFKGKRMAGHMGDEQVTVSGLSVVAIDPEKNILYIKGAIPGARNGMIMIYGKGVMEIKKPEVVEEVKEEAVETPVEEVKEEIADIENKL
jgi:large subunit ribosomal protein L3